VACVQSCASSSDTFIEIKLLYLCCTSSQNEDPSSMKAGDFPCVDKDQCCSVKGQLSGQWVIVLWDRLAQNCSCKFAIGLSLCYIGKRSHCLDLEALKHV
jgi:hypothetical protein